RADGARTGEGSGLESVDQPVAARAFAGAGAGAAVTDAIVQAVVAGHPEIHDIGGDAGTPPENGAGAVVAETRAPLVDRGRALPAAADRRTLLGRPRAEPARRRAVGPVRVRLGVAHALHRTGDADLPVSRRPVQHHCSSRIHAELVALATLVVRVE